MCMHYHHGIGNRLLQERVHLLNYYLDNLTNETLRPLVEPSGCYTPALVAILRIFGSLNNKSQD